MFKLPLSALRQIVATALANHAPKLIAMAVDKLEPDHSSAKDEKIASLSHQLANARQVLATVRGK